MWCLRFGIIVLLGRRPMAGVPPACFLRSIPAGAPAPAGHVTAASAVAGRRPACGEPESARYKQQLIARCLYLSLSSSPTREARGGGRDPTTFGSSDLRFFDVAVASCVRY